MRYKGRVRKVDLEKIQGAFNILAQQLVNGMGWTVPLDHFQRELIKPRALGKKLAQQAIVVLVRSPLPGAMRMDKVDAHLRLLRAEAVLTYFGSLIVREGVAELSRQGSQFAREGLPHGWPRPSLSLAPAM